MWVLLLDLAIVAIWVTLTRSQKSADTMSRDSRWSYSQRR